MLERLEGVDLEEASRRVRELVRDLGVGFNSPEGDGEFRVDPVPRVIAAAEWEPIADGLVQRAAALNAFIADAYSERAIVAAGRVPAHVLDGADHYEPELRGVDLGSAPAAVVGFDLVRGSDGRLVVLEDNLRTPSGITYAVAAREAVDGALGLEPPPRRDPSGAYELLARALAAAGGPDGETVVLSEGETAGAWTEHRELARRLGIAVARPGQLRLRRDRLLAELDEGEVAVGTLYRRADEERLADASGEPTWPARLLVPPVRAGTLAIVNALGTGVADDKLAHAYVEEMVRFYLGEEPLLASVTTYDLFREEVREEMLERIDEIVIKPRSGLGGQDVYIGPVAGAGERDRAATALRERPETLVAQETVALSTHPTVVGGRLEPRHVDLRAYVIGGEAAPVALTRFARGAGAMVVNSSGGGGGKDTWILTA